MRFLITLGATSLFALACTSWIKAHRKALYALATILALLTAAGLGVFLPPALELVLCQPLTRGSLATAFFVLVMYAGALSDSCPIRRKLLSIRGELSIIASILTLGHNLSAGQVYFVRLISAPASMPINHLLATICSLVMLIIMLPLFVTSFPALRRKMSGRSWKQLQRWAYLFYGLTYIHVILLFLPEAQDGSTSALVNLVVFSIVFLAYASLRMQKAIGPGRRARLIPAAAALLTAILVIVSALPQTDSPETGLSNNPSISWQDGVYTGKGRGYAGAVIVEVTVEQGQITFIQVIDHDEDKPYWKKALVTIDRILEEQTSKVDSVAGATKSCKGIQKAVKDALKQAEIGR